MSKKRITSRPGLWGYVYHYDERGNCIGTSRPGLFGKTQVHFDSSGAYAGKSRPGVFSQQVYHGKAGPDVASYQGPFGFFHRSGGRTVASTVPGLAGIRYTTCDGEALNREAATASVHEEKDDRDFWAQLTAELDNEKWENED